MSDWTFKIEFSSSTGTTHDITSLVQYDSISKSEQLFGSGGIGAVDTFGFTVNHSSSMTDLLFGADERIDFKCYATTTDYQFTGKIDMGFSQSYGQIVGPITIEAVDNSWKLDKPIKTSFQFPTTYEGTQYKVFATSSTAISLIHHLLSDAGYSTGDIGTTGSITTALEHVAETAEERTYRAYIDALLPEYGYTYRFDESGKFQAVSLRAPSTASYTFNTANISVNPGLSREKVLQDYEAVEVSWTALSKRVTDVLFSAEGDMDSAGMWDNDNDLLVSNYFPAGSSTDTIWINYNPQYKEQDPALVAVRGFPGQHDFPGAFG